MNKFINKWVHLSFLFGLISIGAFSSHATANNSPKRASLDELNSELGKKLFPSNLLRLDDRFNHHVMLVEKSTHQIYLFENQNGYPKFLKSYIMASGKATGDKKVEGDLKTPEGIYTLTNFHHGETLVKQYGKEGEIYGIGAFVMNYPNLMDYREKKTGGGIWFHGTNDESRIFKGLDSRGCVVAANSDVKEIAQYIQLENTTIVIVQDLHLLTEKTWVTNRTEIEKTIHKWKEAWEKEDLESYISHYHPQEFNDSYRGNYQSFKHYKRAVFNNPGIPKINLRNLSILYNDKYVVAQFEQEYVSNTINDTGKKTLYLKRDENYHWKIVAEVFNKLPDTEKLVFTPSQRYFAN